MSNKNNKKVLTGNFAASYGATVSRAQVIAAYPITPQTTTVEILSEIVANGELDAEFIKVESEHSAMAACIGASAAGARTFTATSAQGLALMHEVLHWAGRARLPIVMANINRAMAPGWSIWADATDSIAQRDTCWMQVYCENNQEVYDSVILAYKIAENQKVLLPMMLNLDAFFLSHTSQVVETRDQEMVDKFLPKLELKYKLDTSDPHAFGGLTGVDNYFEFSYMIQQAMEDAKQVIKDAGKEFKELFGKEYDLIEKYRTDDAEYILITYGTISGTTKDAVDRMREKGIPVGVIKIRVFRPFPGEDLKEALKDCKKIGVIDRAVSFGHEGPFFTETKAAIYGQNKPIYGFIAGLGGRDVSIQDIEKITDIMINNDPSNLNWIGVKK